LPAYRNPPNVGDEKEQEQMETEGASARLPPSSSLDELWFFESDVWNYRKRERGDGGRLLITIDDIARYLGCHRDTVRNMMVQGFLTDIAKASMRKAGGAVEAMGAKSGIGTIVVGANCSTKGQERFDMAEVIALKEKYLISQEAAEMLGWRRDMFYAWLRYRHLPALPVSEAGVHGVASADYDGGGGGGAMGCGCQGH
jgi:hypothetical protein